MFIFPMLSPLSLTISRVRQTYNVIPFHSPFLAVLPPVAFPLPLMSSPSILSISTTLSYISSTISKFLQTYNNLLHLWLTISSIIAPSASPLAPVEFALDPHSLHLIHFRDAFTQILSEFASVVLVASVECCQAAAVDAPRQADTEWVVC